MKQKKKITLAALGTLLLLAAACQTEQLTEPTTPGAGQERTLVIHPVVSPATTTRAGIATRADGGATTTPVSLIGGNLTLTLSHNTNPGATPQIAVYSPAPAATAAATTTTDAPDAAPAPLAYNHGATGDTLRARGLDPTQARALYITAAGNYPLAAQGTALKASSRQTAHAKIYIPGDLSDIPTDATATTTLPFALNARRTDPAPLAIAADGTTNLPLSITSAGLMLRMKHNGTADDGKATIFINSVRYLLTNETAPFIGLDQTDEQAGTASRVVDARFPIPDGGYIPIDVDGIATSYVLFGTLTASEALTAGTPIAEINTTLYTNTASGDRVSEQKTFTLILPRSITPAAGQLLTYTVHVNHSLATIEGDVEISDFTPGNGDGGEQAGVGNVADGTQPLPEDLFNAQNTNWIVTGGGTPEADALVAKNVREALNRIYNPRKEDGSWNDTYTGSTRIDLILLEVSTLPTWDGGAFQSYQQLRSVSLPAAKTIEANAFQSCTNLTTLSLPVATTIGDYAINNCTALTTLSLPKVDSIGKRMFQNCTALTDIDLPVATTIEANAFLNCYALTDIDLPVATTIEANAFQNCTALTTATLPAAKSIGANAFKNCRKLTTLRLTAAGEITLQTDALAGFSNTEACTLVLNPDKKPADGSTSNQWAGQTWKTITYAQQ